jgi:hypothetical protein
MPAYIVLALYFHIQALERRPAQETLIGCVGLHNKKFKSIEHPSYVCVYIPNQLFIKDVTVT